MVTQKADGTVVFRFLRPHSSQVTVVGEFNNWDPNRLPMKRAADGWWQCEARLEPGFYQFLYISDGEYHRDYAAFGLVHTPFGMNSVVRVDAPSVRVAETEQPEEKARPQRSRKRRSRKNRTRREVAVA